jgi:hypothetical protein
VNTGPLLLRMWFENHINRIAMLGNRLDIAVCREDEWSVSRPVERFIVDSSWHVGARKSLTKEWICSTHPCHCDTDDLHLRRYMTIIESHRGIDASNRRG